MYVDAKLCIYPESRLLLLIIICWCSLYTKLSAGLHFQSLYLDSKGLSKEEIAPYDKSHVSLAYSVVPFGLEIGKRNISWFMEVGIGSNTNFITGFSYRFGRY